VTGTGLRVGYDRCDVWLSGMMEMEVEIPVVELDFQLDGALCDGEIDPLPIP